MHEKSNLPHWQNNLKKSNPYLTPDGCFDELTLCVQDRITEKRQRTFIRELPGRLVVAVSFLLLFLTGYIGYGSLFSKPVNFTDDNEYAGSVPRTIQAFPDEDDRLSEEIKFNFP